MSRSKRWKPIKDPGPTGPQFALRRGDQTVAEVGIVSTGPNAGRWYWSGAPAGVAYNSLRYGATWPTPAEAKSAVHGWITCVVEELGHVLQWSEKEQRSICARCGHRAGEGIQIRPMTPEEIAAHANDPRPVSTPAARPTPPKRVDTAAELTQQRMERWPSFASVMDIAFPPKDET